MNKLYIIHFKLSNGYIVSTWTAWSEEAVQDKIRKNPEWKYSIVADNDTHKIWDAK